MRFDFVPAMLWPDVRFAVRSLRRSLAFAATAVLLLTVAIGGITTIFSVLNAAILRPLPVAHPDRLVRLTYPGISADGVTPEDESFTFSYSLFRQFRDAAGDLARLLAFTLPDRAEVRVGAATAAAEPLTIQYVSADAFDALGIGAARGRVLTAGDDGEAGQHPVAVLSHSAWLGRFGGDPAVIGRPVWIGGTAYSIVGVARAGFFGIEPGRFVDLWLPATMFERRALENDGWNFAQLFGILNRDITPPQLQARLQPAFHDAEARLVRGSVTMPPIIRDQFLSGVIRVNGAPAGASGFRERFGSPLWMVFGIAAILLLITCANLVSLFLSRAAERAAETSVRMSLGASRRHVLRPLLIESVLLSTVAGGLGWLLAQFGAPRLVDAVSTDANPLRFVLEADVRVFAFTLLVSAIVALACGSIPAWRASSIAAGMARGAYARHTGGHLRFSRGLVVLQVAFSTCLVAGVTVFAASVWHLARVDLGLDPENVVVLKMTGGTDIAGAEAAWRRASRVRERLEGQPGVRSVAVAAEWAPFEGSGWREQVLRQGRPVPAREEIYYPISPGYFSTLHIPFVAGRDFDERDGRTGDMAPAIVNRALVNAYFDGRDAVGQVFRHPSSPVPQIIVGVVENTHFTSARDAAEPMVYVPLGPGSPFTLYVRTPVPPATVARMVETRTGDDAGHARNITTLQTLVTRTMFRERLLAGVGSVFAVVGFGLSLIGVFGLLSYAVGGRRRELGIRAALGARPARLMRTVVADAVLTASGGVAVGLVAASGLVRFVQAWLFGVAPTDLLVLGGVPALFVVGAAVAAAVPAYRAASVDPREALNGSF